MRSLTSPATSSVEPTLGAQGPPLQVSAAFAIEGRLVRGRGQYEDQKAVACKVWSPPRWNWLMEIQLASQAGGSLEESRTSLRGSRYPVLYYPVIMW